MATTKKAKKKTIKLTDVASKKLRAKLKLKKKAALTFYSHVCTKSDVPKYDRPSAKQTNWREGAWPALFKEHAHTCHENVKKASLRGKHGGALKAALRANGKKIGACIKRLLKNAPR